MMSKKLTALAIVALIGLTMCSIALAKKPPKPDPEPEPPYNPAIAYESGFRNIWVMNADGSNNTLVTENAVQPQWSPEGDKLLFHVFVGLDSPTWWSLYSVNLDGSDRSLVSVVQGACEWSPGSVLEQGDKIVFSTQLDHQDPYGQLEIFMIDPEVPGSVQLTDTPEVSEYDVSWSPEADRIAVISFDPVNFLPQQLWIYELGLDEFGKIIVTNRINVNELADAYHGGATYPTELCHLEWANSLEKVAVLVQDASNPSGDIWTLDLKEPYEMRRITGQGREADFPLPYERRPTWSPDDNRIAFDVRGGSNRYKKYRGIYVVDAADGKNMEKLDDGGISPDWYRYAE